MNNKMFALSTAFVCSVAIAGFAWGQPYWMRGGVGVPLQMLGLTAEQTSQIQDIVAKTEKELMPIRSNLQAKNMELRYQMWDPDADPSSVEALWKEVGDLRAEIERRSMEERDSIRDVLTEQQRAIYDQQGLYNGWNRGISGFGPGAGWCGGLGCGGGFGVGAGPGRGAGFRDGAGPGWGRGMGWCPGITGQNWSQGAYGPGAYGMRPWMGRWRW